MEVKSPIDPDIEKLYKIARLSFIRVRRRRKSSISSLPMFPVGDTRDVSPVLGWNHAEIDQATMHAMKY